ncbi:hypothetical protein BJ742DRAFT_821125 [Cladochytrium replicatum]|nr:hypothetical protein BJ742DRAFT_821125 [Cladochytrium replicatum]
MIKFSHRQLVESVKDVNLKGKVALVIGGSSGIGAGTATSLARLGASVTVVGRSDSKCKTVVEQMKSVSPASSSANLSYSTLDCGDLKATQAFLESYASKTPRLDFLVLSVGGFNAKGLVTPDCTRVLAVNYISRFAAIKYLAPLLSRTAQTAPVRVMYVGNPKLGGTTLDGVRDDMGAVNAKGFRGLLKSLSLAMYANIMTDEFARQNPKVAMIHIHPGFISTDFQVPFPVNYFAPIIKLFGDSIEYAGDRISYYLTKFDCEGKLGKGIFVGIKDEEVEFKWAGDTAADYDTAMKYMQGVLDQTR